MEFETLSVGKMGDTGKTVSSGKERGAFLGSKNHSTAEKQAHSLGSPTVELGPWMT